MRSNIISAAEFSASHNIDICVYIFGSRIFKSLHFLVIKKIEHK
jgi:hypothetical protein